MRDIGDDKQVKQREDELKALKASRALVIRTLCDHREGRDFLWWLCEQGSPYASSMRYDTQERGDPMRTSYAEGWRGLGTLILSEIMDASPRGYILMLTEQRNLKTLEKVNEQPGTTTQTVTEPNLVAPDPKAAPVADPKAAPVAAAADPKVDLKVEPPKTDASGSPLGAKAETKVDPAAPAEPVKYDFKIPEGVKLDEAKLATFSALGNELKLAPEAAQKLLDFHTSEVKAGIEAITKAVNDSNVKAYNDLITGWKKGIEGDPELSGSNADAVHEILGKALDTYFSKEAREAFDTTGAGWNPAVIKGFLKMAKALSEGAPTDQGNPPRMGNKGKTPGQVMYPDKAAN